MLPPRFLPQAALCGCRFHLGQSCSGVECSRWISVKNNETPDLNPATTNGCESYHAHLNADFFYFAQTFTYLSRRYCDNRHPRTFLWRHFHSHGQFTRTTQRSPHFCDACTLTKPRGTCVQKTVLAVCIVPILSCLNVL